MGPPMSFSPKSALAAAALVAVLAGPCVADAAMTTLPSGHEIDFAPFNTFGVNPVDVAPGVTWSSTNDNDQGGSVYGFSHGYSFGANGYSNDVVAGLNDSSDYFGVADSMTFSFSHPVSSVGAVLNWVPNGAPVTIAVYDASHTLLDSLTLSEGERNLFAPDSYYGFSEKAPDIASFVLTDGYIAAIGGVYVSPAPEPSTWAMMLTGFGVLGAVIRGARRSGIALA
jgi:hypothetical protein